MAATVLRESSPSMPLCLPHLFRSPTRMSRRDFRASFAALLSVENARATADGARPERSYLQHVVSEARVLLSYFFCVANPCPTHDVTDMLHRGEDLNGPDFGMSESAAPLQSRLEVLSLNLGR